MPGFSRLKPFIKSFANTARVTSQIMEILKNKGLNQTSYEQCITLSTQLPRGSVVRKRAQSWLEKHISIQETITAYPLLVSSDIIESLFGKFKHVIERSSHADINRTALLIPALCGNIDERIVERAFYPANQRDLKDWEKENIPYTMRKKRQKFFRDTGSSQKLVNKAVS